jgi:RNA polymerase sigma-70 factor (ECF subfamily)
LSYPFGIQQIAVDEHKSIMAGKYKSDEEKRRAFEKIAFTHVDALYNTALRMTRNTLDAEDLLQDVYLRAFRFFDKFEEGTNFKAWIFKILTNTYINRYRQKARQPQQQDFSKVEFSHGDDSKGRDEKFETHFDESLYRELFEDEIREALDGLSYDFRTVVLLCDVEGFSYKEIAAIIGKPIGTVMSRLSRARQQLQAQLAEFARREGYIRKT